MSIETARKLRKGMTDAERALWRLLRGRRMAGWRFRRQEPIGGFIVDFICFEARLVIEVDGGSISNPKPTRSAMPICVRRDFACCGSGTTTSCRTLTACAGRSSQR